MDQLKSSFASWKMTSVLKAESISDEQHGAILLAGDNNKPTDLNAKLLILERRKMSNRVVPSSSFILL